MRAYSAARMVRVVWSGPLPGWSFIMIAAKRTLVRVARSAGRGAQYIYGQSLGRMQVIEMIMLVTAKTSAGRRFQERRLGTREVAFPRSSPTPSLGRRPTGARRLMTCWRLRAWGGICSVTRSLQATATAPCWRTTQTGWWRGRRFWQHRPECGLLRIPSRSGRTSGRRVLVSLA